MPSLLLGSALHGRRKYLISSVTASTRLSFAFVKMDQEPKAARPEEAHLGFLPRLWRVQRVAAARQRVGKVNDFLSLASLLTIALP